VFLINILKPRTLLVQLYLIGPRCFPSGEE
jgi:hypothetical protein